MLTAFRITFIYAGLGIFFSIMSLYSINALILRLLVIAKRPDKLKAKIALAKLGKSFVWLSTQIGNGSNEFEFPHGFGPVLIANIGIVICLTYGLIYFLSLLIENVDQDYKYPLIILMAFIVLVSMNSFINLVKFASLINKE